jgi:hypothetical protein
MWREEDLVIADEIYDRRIEDMIEAEKALPSFRTCIICSKQLSFSSMGIKKHLEKHVREKVLKVEDLFKTVDLVLKG